MNVRFTNAIPLAPRSAVKHYAKDAKDLMEACRTGDVSAVQAWATRLIERIGRQARFSATPEYVVKRSRRLDRKQINDEVEDILNEAREVRLLGDRPGKTEISLSRVRIFLAHLHGFESWMKFAKHVELLAKMKECSLRCRKRCRDDAGIRATRNDSSRTSFGSRKRHCDSAYCV